MSIEIKRKKIRKIVYAIIAIIILLIIVIAGSILTKKIATNIAINKTREKLSNINSKELQEQIINELNNTNLNVKLKSETIELETIINEGINYEGYITAKISCLQNGTTIGTMEVPCFKIISDKTGKFKSIEYTYSFMKSTIISDTVKKILKNSYGLDNFDEIMGSEKYKNEFKKIGTKGEIYCTDNEYFFIVYKKIQNVDYTMKNYYDNKTFFDGLKKYEMINFGLDI